MRRLWIVSLLVLTLTAAPAFAQGKGGKGKPPQGTAAGGEGPGRGYGKGAAHGRGQDGRPAGWDQGKKTGWGDCDVPPGQAKKEGCGIVRSGKGKGKRHGGGQSAQRRSVPAGQPAVNAGRDTRGSRTATTPTVPSTASAPRRPATSPMPSTPTTSKKAPAGTEAANDRVEPVTRKR